MTDERQLTVSEEAHLPFKYAAYKMVVRPLARLSMVISGPVLALTVLWLMKYRLTVNDLGFVIIFSSFVSMAITLGWGKLLRLNSK